MNGFFLRFALFFAVIFGVIFMLVWFYLSATSPADAADLVPTHSTESTLFETESFAITTQGGQTHEFVVELAASPAQQRRGLMFRKSLGAGRGMLFDYNPPRRIAMWMKNTHISLDMVFADAKGRVVHIATHTEPFSQDLIPAPVAVRYVLEVPAGTVAALGLGLGDRFVRR